MIESKMNTEDLSQNWSSFTGIIVVSVKNKERGREGNPLDVPLKIMRITFR